MTTEHTNEAEFIDPSILRGLTSRRLTRRDALRVGGLGLGASALLAACGGSTPKVNVGTAAWWAKQKLHHHVNFANWPIYIDVVGSHHPSLDHFTKTTGITISYSEVIEDNPSFYAKIRPSLQAGQSTGYDLIVMSNNSTRLGYLIENKWLNPIDHTMMANFNTYASPLVKNPSWDPHNKYTMAWQSGWTTLGYNAATVKNPGDSVEILFNKKYAGRVGMLADPEELGSIGLLAIGVDPATSTESDWRKAAKLLQKQKSDGIVAGYYAQDYIQHLKNGDIDVSMVYSGDIFQANLDSRYKSLKLLLPHEGAMFWTDNMCIPLHAQNPKDAMTLMDFFYSPLTQAVVEYNDDYICPVPSAKQELLHPTGWAVGALNEMKSTIGLPTTVTANAPTVFPNAAYMALSKPYYRFKNQEEITAWNNLFLPIVQGA